MSGLIGKGGAVIRELMLRSGAVIQVSQKGEGGSSAERTVGMAPPPTRTRNPKA